MRSPGQHGAVAAVFVVRLPAGERRVPAVAPRERFDDARALTDVDRRGERVVPARAEAARPPLIVDRRDVGMLVHQPLRRRRGRRAEHDFEPRSAEDVEGAIEPAPVKVAASRFEARPCEFADAHICDAQFAHAPRVLGPDVLRPMFRIVADAEHQDSIRRLGGLSRPSGGVAHLNDAAPVFS